MIPRDTARDDIVSHGDLLILGLGNLLCADDGLGVEVVTRLRRLYDPPAGVRVLDGGTLGMSLLHWMAGTPNVILVDAIGDDAPPGSFVRLEGDDVAPAVRERLSVHQVGVTDLLDGLRLIDAYPAQLVLLGLVPESVELRVGLSPALERNVEELVEEVAAEAARLGFALERKHETDAASPSDSPTGTSPSLQETARSNVDSRLDESRAVNPPPPGETMGHA